MTWKKKTAIILLAFTALIISTAIYSVIWRIQYSNNMRSEGCRIASYDVFGLPSSWQCLINLGHITNV